ncbi:MAG TPA: hotdog domain-containing protein [Spongiibacteraceae bacterium]|jgi:acyl-CoA hydrolase|nr:hotdog domain-containing protein [Spongiibacteraceae bacterium]HUH36367.1 hotdog domain-containing protein [Spongiibacteraceae bacterium]
MQYHSRRLVKYGDLNAAERLFGGTLLAWIDEEAVIFASCRLGSKRLVTKFMSEINFVSPGKLGDIIELGVEATAVGTTSLTMRCNVRNKDTLQTILDIERIVFVCVDEQGQPRAHGKQPEDLGLPARR